MSNPEILDDAVRVVYQTLGLGAIHPADIQWGPTGEAIYDRTYARPLADGTREWWPATVARVVYGNLALVHGHPAQWQADVWNEAKALAHHFVTFKILPAGRHLWASGIKGRQFLFNCHVAGWDSDPKTHADFHLMRLAEGGGVGANYSQRHLKVMGAPVTDVTAHVVCDPSHPDYTAMKDAGLLSETYAANWPGAFEVEDTREGWSAAIGALIDAAWSRETKHPARVFDVSRIRWSGARLKSMGGTASGPQPLAKALGDIGRTLTRAARRNRSEQPWGPSTDPGRIEALSAVEAMEIDHYIAEAIVAGGNRRSARMSICHWNDPHINEFLACKSDPSMHWTTNISVEIDDEFVSLVTRYNPPVGTSRRRWNDQQIKAREILNKVVTGMLTNGEPGFWNSSLSNVGEPNEVVATNPCGEIALEPWENCNLAHVNMDAFPPEEFAELQEAHRLAARFLIRATYGDVIDGKQADVLARNRRIGLGHFGVQGFLAKQGIRYSEAPNVQVFRNDLETLAQTVDDAVREYAHELRIPVPVKTRTVAPTGTIAKLAGRTEGIHPIYARHFVRRVRYSTTDAHQAAQIKTLKDAGHHVEPDQYAANTAVVEFLTEDNLVAEVRDMGLDDSLVEAVDEISLDSMLAFQELYQVHWADNAVSFTVNVPAEPHQAEDMTEPGKAVRPPTPNRVAETTRSLVKVLPNLKGTTMMLDGSRPQAPYERITAEEFSARKFAGHHVTHDASYDEECASGACPIR